MAGEISSLPAAVPAVGDQFEFLDKSVTPPAAGTNSRCGPEELLWMPWTGEVSVTGAVTLTSTAFGKSHVCSGTAADYTVTLPTAAGNAGKFIKFRMSPALTRFVTLDGNGSQTINGALTRVMWSGESVTLVSDGSNWFAGEGPVLKPLLCALRRTTSQTIPNGVGATVQFATTDVDNSTRMADTTTHRITARRAGQYLAVANLVYGQFTAGGWAAVYLNKNGTLFDFCEVNATLDLYASPRITRVMAMAAGDYVDVQAVQESGGVSQDLYASAGEDESTLALVEYPAW